MNTQVNNPLYQQFVELVNTTSSGVIEQCVEPLSKTLFESQKEISKIQLVERPISLLGMKKGQFQGMSWI